jgi:CRISPR type I-E-associated protein CasA/Cse1
MLTLAHAPWLDFVDGQRHSLRSALKEAHTLTDLRGNSVLETFALYRFLAAIVQRVYAPKSLDDICAMREIGFFSPAGIETFCGDNLLWLTDFMQVPDLTGDAKSIGYLTFDAPTGSDPVFFQHRAQDKDKAYCQRCVAYGLISLSAWQTIGGQGLTASLNGTPPLYVLPKGSSLFDVLTRCLVPQQTDEIANDWGVWKRRICPHAYPQITYLHGLTFMPRCVKVPWSLHWQGKA